MANQVESTEKTATARGEDTRRRLIEAAFSLFLQNGYHGTSMRQIAQAAGMAVGGIYNHFGSKEDIFVEVLDQYHPYHVIVPALNQAEGDRLEDFLRHLTALVHDAIQDRKDQILPLVYIELVEFQGRHIQTLAARIVPAFTPFLQKFAERQSELRPVPVPVIQRTFVALLIGYYVTEYLLSSSPLMVDKTLDWQGGLLDVFLHGALKPHGQA